MSMIKHRKRDSKGRFHEPFAGRLHDLEKSLARRLYDAKGPCGPYEMRPTRTSDDAIGFYMDQSKVWRMARHGASIDLRIEKAPPAGQSGVYAYWTDEYGIGDKMFPIVARLPHGRGFLVGWTMGAGMCATLERDVIVGDFEEACQRAHAYTEAAAADEREYQARQDDEEEGVQELHEAMAYALV